MAIQGLVCDDTDSHNVILCWEGWLVNQIKGLRLAYEKATDKDHSVTTQSTVHIE